MAVEVRTGNNANSTHQYDHTSLNGTYENDSFVETSLWNVSSLHVLSTVNVYHGVP